MKEKRAPWYNYCSTMLWNALKVCLIIIASSFNLPIAFRIFVRRSVQNIFNVSLACLFGILGIISPLLIHLYLKIFENQQIDAHDKNIEEARFDCARFTEVRNIYLMAEQIMGNNIIFRYFFIVHAHRGFITSGVYNSRLAMFAFLIYTIVQATYAFLPWLTASALDKNYPENTVKGRICLGLRLDWDKDRTKETSDVYIKPRLIVVVLTVITLIWTEYKCGYKARLFMRKFCLNQRSFASIGGTRRRNILTQLELCKYHGVIFFYLIAESLLFLWFNFYQDQIGSENVFLINFIFMAVIDSFNIIIRPVMILYTSLVTYPELWSNVEHKSQKFFMTDIKLIPRNPTMEKICVDINQLRDLPFKLEPTSLPAATHAEIAWDQRKSIPLDGKGSSRQDQGHSYPEPARLMLPRKGKINCKYLLQYIFSDISLPPIDI